MISVVFWKTWQVRIVSTCSGRKIEPLDDWMDTVYDEPSTPVAGSDGVVLAPVEYLKVCWGTQVECRMPTARSDTPHSHR